MKKKITIILTLIVLITFITILYFNYNESKDKVYFLPNPLTFEYASSTNCTLTHTGSVANLSTSVKPENEVRISELSIQQNGIKFKFENLDKESVNVTIGDSIGLTNTIALKISENNEVIHLIGFWGMTNQDIASYSIYKKTGFFTYARSGDVMLLGQSLMSGFGRCF